MKVIAINGSPHKEGNTWHAIKMVFEELEKEGIETEIIHIGDKPVRSCIACGMCRKKPGMCQAFQDDGVNEALDKMREADGLLLASPVHFAGVSGAMKCFCDRFFYVATATQDILRHKVGATITAVRRAGGINALDIMYKYLEYSEMMLATSSYWTVAYGLEAGEAEKDEEGKSVMQILGRNMAWMLKTREKGLAEAPDFVAKARTNFIR